VLRLLSGIDRSRFEPWLAVFEAQPDEARSLLADFRSAGVRVVVLAQSGRLAPRSMARYGKLLRVGRFDLVHTHSLRADLATLAWRWSLRPQPRLVRSVHNMDPYVAGRILGPISSAALTRFDRVIAISDAVARYLRANTDVRPERLTRVYYGLEPASAPVYEPCLVERRSLLVAARLDPQKGQDLLIEALQTVRRAVPNVEAWLAGHETGTSASSLRALAERLGVKEHVRFLGFRSDLPALMSAADIVVLPSRWEGFGLVLLEAMNAARPIVATRVGPVPEVVEDGVTGVLVPPDDPGALADAVVDLFRDPDRARRMGRAGRARLIQHFSERAMIQAIETLYNSLLSDATQTASGYHGAARAATS